MGATPAQRLAGFLCVLTAILWVMQALGAAPRTTALVAATVLPTLTQGSASGHAVWAADADERLDARAAEDAESSSSSSDKDSDDDEQNDEDDESEVALAHLGPASLASPPWDTLPIESTRLAMDVWHSRLPRPVEPG